MNPSTWFSDATRRLALRGFNLIGVAEVRRFDAAAPAGHRLCDLDPKARSAIVVASGGRLLWERLTPFRTGGVPPVGDRRSDGLTESFETDPIDAYTELALTEEASSFAATFPAAHLRILYPFIEEPPLVSFMRLAEEAGIGMLDNYLRLLLHPRYGPWVSVRGCLLTEFELPPTGKLAGFRPCDGCPRPCLESCPVGALAPDRWDHASCLAYRRSGPNCLEGCAPRLDCPVGGEHRHGPEEMRHRQLAALE
jgi:hypothetical protein